MRFFILSGVFGLLSSLLVFVASPAYALEDISYVDFQHNASTRSLFSFLEQEGQDETPVGLVDLNDDGIAEMIVKQCEAGAALCLHSIWAERGELYTKLGDIPALRLSLGRESHHGVRDILAYDDPRNDYHAIVYLWDAMNSRYIKE